MTNSRFDTIVCGPIKVYTVIHRLRVSNPFHREANKLTSLPYERFSCRRFVFQVEACRFSGLMFVFIENAKIWTKIFLQPDNCVFIGVCSNKTLWQSYCNRGACVCFMFDRYVYTLSLNASAASRFFNVIWWIIIIARRHLSCRFNSLAQSIGVASVHHQFGCHSI